METPRSDPEVRTPSLSWDSPRKRNYLDSPLFDSTGDHTGVEWTGSRMTGTSEKKISL